MWFLKKKKIGIIGYGNMGSAIAGRLKTRFPVYVFDKDAAKTANLTGVNVCQNPKELVEIVETVILAIKPQDFEALLKELAGSVQDKLVISIAAGIPTQYIEKILGRIRVVRVMPNLPAKIGKGVSWLSKGRFVSEADLNFVAKLFNRLGVTFFIDESMMDAATAVSGSGPGFWGYLASAGNKSFDDVEFVNAFTTELEKAAVKEGFRRGPARFATLATAEGTAAYVKSSGLSAEELVAQVASPGGTTEAGLEVLRKGGSLGEAVKAAKKKSQELSKKE